MKRSAGILMYKFEQSVGVEVLIAHMGGPFWERKDAGAWSLPKGELADGEDPFEVAKREFEEELGSPPPQGEYASLGEVAQRSGKRISIYAVEGDLDTTEVSSNLFEMEWPRGSGKMASFPEIDRAAWVSVPTARQKLVKGQVEFLDRLIAELQSRGVAIETSNEAGASSGDPPSLF